MPKKICEISASNWFYNKETQPAFWPVVRKVLSFITFMEQTVDVNRLRNKGETVFPVENTVTFSE